MSPCRTARPSLALAFTVLLSACAALLPTSKTEIVSSWNSYDEAVKSLTSLKANATTRGEVHAIGLDPAINPAITVLHFGEVLQRFSTAPLSEAAELDEGVRQCLKAGRRCSGYAVAVRKVSSDRVGNFWLDAFNFKRETYTTGWSVDALLVFVDDVLVYGLVGGQPTIKQVSVTRNPLGPLQGWGDYVLTVIK